MAGWPFNLIDGELGLQCERQKTTRRFYLIMSQSLQALMQLFRLVRLLLVFLDSLDRAWTELSNCPMLG